MPHQFDPTVLREYDIRGIIGETLGADDARAIGRGFGTLLGREGGRLVAVVGGHAVAKAVLWTRSGAATSRAPAFDAAVAELPGFERAGPSFVF